MDISQHSIDQMSLSQLRFAIDDGQLTSETLCNHYHQQSLQKNTKINAYIHLIDQNTLLSLLNKVETGSNSKAKHNALAGIPIAHKDLFCTIDYPTTCGSKMLEKFVSPFDAEIVAATRRSGAVILGKTNMDEFAMGSANETSYFGPVPNPWDLSRVAGGSSGGSAAAVAAGMIPLATASDTGGSIRQPAAFCGVTGFKPTYGSISRWGMVAFASSLDQAGPIAKSAEDCAFFMDEVNYADPKDSTCFQGQRKKFFSGLQQDYNFNGKTIGYLPTWLAHEGLDKEILAAYNATQAHFESLGAKFVPLELPSLYYAMPAYYILAPAEASSNLSRFDGVRFGHRCENPIDLEDLYKRSRQEGFGREVKRRILTGTYVLSEGYFDKYYKQAQKIRRLIRDDFDQAFKQVDAILTPTTPSVAFKSGITNRDPVEVYLQDIFTIPANLAGLPAISFPVQQVHNLPIGMQLFGQRFNDDIILQMAHKFQQTTTFHQQVCPANL